MARVWIIMSLLITSSLITGGRSESKADDVSSSPTPSIFDNETHRDICMSCYCEPGYPYLIDCSARDFDSLPIELDWFDDTSDVQVVMDRNNMLFIPSVEGPLTISRLSFRHNKIKKIAFSAFTSLRKLTVLDLAYNFIPSAALTKDVFQGPYDSQGYMQLNITTLDLSYNLIHSLDKDVFDHAEGIRELYLDGNPIRIIDHQLGVALTTLRSLRMLSLAKTGLSQLPLEIFDAFMNLQVINLASNNLITVPPALKHTRSLTVLSLSNNPITDFDQSSFEGLSKLRELSISEMSKLEKIDSFTFGTLKDLKILHCSYNKKLKFISSKAFLTPDGFSVYLSEIHLNDNQLKTLSKQMLPYETLRILNIQENPFICDCHLEWMYDGFLDQLSDKNPQYTLNLDCMYPKSLEGTSLYGISKNDLSSCSSFSEYITTGKEYEEHHYTAVSVTVISIIFVFIIAVFGLVYFYKKAKNSPINLITQQVRYSKADTDEKVDV